MTGDTFGAVVLAIGLVGLAAILSNRLSARIRVPAPAFFLVAAAVVAELRPHAAQLPVSTVQHVVTIALAVILFDGGMHIGWRRFRAAAGAITWIGVAGTLVTAAGAALAARWLAALDWRMSLLLGTAVAATDPAVVFSVFGRREVSGRTGTLLEGESGANDPVGIALLGALLGATGSAGGIAVHVLISFATQMAVGAVAGAALGYGLLELMRRVPLPSEGLYSPRVLAGALAIYGVADVAHGSGFLAVFVAGIVIGDEPAPYKREIERFHSSMASLAEVVAFVMLGLTVNLSSLGNDNAWAAGLAIAALLALVIRPVLVGLVSLPVRLSRPERVFFLWTGLKGAVPILLGSAIAESGTAGAARAYEIIFVIVGFSVTIQGGLVPGLASRLRIPLRTVEPEPWSLGVRLREQPEGLHRYQVGAGSPADGTTVGDLAGGEDTWVSLVVRDGTLLTPGDDTRLEPGDEVLLLSPPDNAEAIERLFRARSAPGEDPGPGRVP
ncbi:MAG TPA: potassium/proton antiporter [Trebonia sp.]|jgi:cell volume regulation protein A|nr:potassium/proton antiporter [Trebonia sp.]